MASSASLLRSICVVLVLLGSSLALAQQADEEEPTPPDQRQRQTNSSKATRKPAAPPVAVQPPAASATEPRPPEPPVDTGAKSAVLYGIGVQARAIFVPEWLQNAFLASSNALHSGALAVQFIRRKGNFDLMANIDFGFYSPPDGTYLGKNEVPEIDANYIQFRNLNVLGFEVAFIWHHEILPWLSLIYGGGLGIGVVLGDIYRIHGFTGNCHGDNLKNYRQCNPVSPTDTQGLADWNSNRNAWLSAHTGSGSDSSSSPHLYREDGVWPVVPIIHLLGGLDFKINEQFGAQLHGGFHTAAFYLGATGLYFF